MAADRYWDQAAETLPRPELEALQVRRVRECVERLQRSEIPFYRRLEGIDAAQIRTIDDLSLLPFTLKDHLRETYPLGMLAVPRREVAQVHASSGTTGRPSVVGYTRADLELWANVLARGLIAAGLTEEDVFLNATGYGLFTGGLGYHGAVAKVGALIVPTGAGNTARQVMLMRDLGVTVLNSTPSYAVHIAEVAAAEGIDSRALPVRIAFLGAEPMSVGLQREIEDRFGLTVFEQYGLSEIIGPGVASTCQEQSGIHIWEDHFIPEIVDPETGQRLPDGQIGELVLTAPTKQASPMLRYRTRDRASMTRESCGCGRTGARIGKILGRTDDMVIVRGVNVFPSQIEHALLGVDGFSPNYQIVLANRADRLDELRVRIESAEALPADSPGVAALTSRAHRALRDALGLSVVVEVLRPGTLPRSEGKAVRMIDRRQG